MSQDIFERADKALEEAKKLSTKDRKELKSNNFCGPNKSFPCNDCNHVAAAKAMLGRSKFSDATKKKIAACINKKAEALGCTENKKSEASVNEFLKYIELSGEQKKLYSSEVFSSTKAIVDASIKNKGTNDEDLIWI